MVTLNKINYKKISFENKEELTDSLIKKIYEINKLIDKDQFTYDEYKQKIISKVYRRDYIFYFMFNNKELIGGIYGDLKTHDSYFVENFYVKRKYIQEGIGTKIMMRAIADLRANHKVSEITMKPFSATKIVNNKISGEHPIKIKIKEKGKQITSKEIFRTFKSNFEYKVESNPESPIEKIIIKKKEIPKIKPRRV